MEQRIRNLNKWSADDRPIISANFVQFAQLWDTSGRRAPKIIEIIWAYYSPVEQPPPSKVYRRLDLTSSPKNWLRHFANPSPDLYRDEKFEIWLSFSTPVVSESPWAVLSYWHDSAICCSKMSKNRHTVANSRITSSCSGYQWLFCIFSRSGTEETDSSMHCSILLKFGIGWCIMKLVIRAENDWRGGRQCIANYNSYMK